MPEGAAVGRGTSWVRYLTLAAIATLVVVISLPRLREFALRENEADAKALLTRLGSTLAVHAAERPENVAALVAKSDDMLPWLTDADYLEQGRLLRRHGYLFDVVEGGDRHWIVRAWPWQAGRTGVRAFAERAGEAPVVHANDAARFSGPTGAPAIEELDATLGWRLANPAD
jgi:hypothetical protein